MLRTFLTLAVACGAIPGTIPHAEAVTYKLLYSFQGGSDGASPQASLVNVDGILYGTTFSGGASGLGAVFSLNPATGAEQVVYSFKGGDDGANPAAALIKVGHTLYGTTSVGGGSKYCGSGCGVVFSLNPETGAEKIIHAFEGGSDGAYVVASLISVDGILYGTTAFGGGFEDCESINGDGCGTVFSLNPKTSAEQVVHAFNGRDGYWLQASLISVGGALYGTDPIVGPLSRGAVFTLNPTTGAVTDQYLFQGGSDGENPYASLIEVGSTLYGTTAVGGASGGGTVFSFSPTTGAEKVVYSFAGGHDGAYPYGGLINAGNYLYGTTSDGGRSANCKYGCGTVFSLNLMTGAKRVEYRFQGGSDGYYPRVSMIKVGGALYGTTEQGGSTNCSGGCGTVFAIMP
jgi:uncharacterized repeat protein (TIGR03803 family)